MHSEYVGLKFPIRVCNVIMAVMKTTIALKSIGVIKEELEMVKRFGDVLSLPGMADYVSLCV